MQCVELPDIEPASLRAVVDPGAYLRGVRYAAQGAVVQFRWEPSQSALQGLVRGSAGGFYTTIAYFSPGATCSPGTTGAPRFSSGVCSCPVAADCKHVVALVLTATGKGAGPAAGQVPATPPGAAGAVVAVPAPSPQPPPAPPWQARIDSLLASPSGAAAGPGDVPLAIELTLVAAVPQAYHRSRRQESNPAPRLTARLVQPRGTGWAGGSLSWRSWTPCGTTATTAPSRCGCCRRSTRCTGTAAAGLATTATATRSTSTSARSSPGSCGRCWTTQTRPGCAWCTAATGLATWRSSGRRSSSST